jgi:hypothetical protein
MCLSGVVLCVTNVDIHNLIFKIYKGTQTHTHTPTHILMSQEG